MRGRGINTVGRVYLRGAAIPAAVGAKPHVIRPRKAKVLKVGDRYAAYVKHPGSRANDFFVRGVTRSAVHSG